MDKVKIGLVGCGSISETYFESEDKFDILEIEACADIVEEKAVEKRRKYGVSKACDVDEIFADPEIDIILNLTPPKAHAEVTISALETGKNVYVEKPLAISLDEAEEIMEKAERNDLKIGCAPDTFLGGGLQTCRKLIDDGYIGEPIGATASVMCHGHES